jgi:hypothetical protein
MPFIYNQRDSFKLHKNFTHNIIWHTSFGIMLFSITVVRHNSSFAKKCFGILLIGITSFGITNLV